MTPVDYGGNAWHLLAHTCSACLRQVSEDIVTTTACIMITVEDSVKKGLDLIRFTVKLAG